MLTNEERFFTVSPVRLGDPTLPTCTAPASPRMVVPQQDRVAPVGRYDVKSGFGSAADVRTVQGCCARALESAERAWWSPCALFAMRGPARPTDFCLRERFGASTCAYHHQRLPGVAADCTNRVPPPATRSWNAPCARYRRDFATTASPPIHTTPTVGRGTAPPRARESLS